jgi:ATP-dependent Clp protease adapter protein ClpS
MLSDLMISEDIIIFPEEKGKEKKEKERNKEKKTKKTALSETTRFAISKAMDDVSLMRFMMKLIFYLLHVSNKSIFYCYYYHHHLVVCWLTPQNKETKKTSTVPRTSIHVM